MGISNTHGSITVGKKQFYYHQAHSFLLSIALCFWSNLIDTVFLEEKYHIKEELLGSFFYLNVSLFQNKTSLRNHLIFVKTFTK
jgi:hypothetical protein